MWCRVQRAGGRGGPLPLAGGRAVPGAVRAAAAAHGPEATAVPAAAARRRLTAGQYHHIQGLLRETFIIDLPLGIC